MEACPSETTCEVTSRRAPRNHPAPPSNSRVHCTRLALDPPWRTWSRHSVEEKRSPGRPQGERGNRPRLQMRTRVLQGLQRCYANPTKPRWQLRLRPWWKDRGDRQHLRTKDPCLPPPRLVAKGFLPPPLPLPPRPSLARTDPANRCPCPSSNPNPRRSCRNQNRCPWRLDVRTANFPRSPRRCAAVTCLPSKTANGRPWTREPRQNRTALSRSTTYSRCE
mmetsp:Transcript_9882/g.60226  ORF Transcript_9882/g.60226 Transcript_9882/m.60226 type:complete len:221 (-) Transcript_9882:1506-2168(-)